MGVNSTTIMEEIFITNKFSHFQNLKHNERVHTNILTEDLKITKSTRICSNHFHKDVVITQYISLGTEGERYNIVTTDNQ